MAVVKQPSSTGRTVLVTFRIPAEAGAARAQVLGDFNEWSPTDMQVSVDGGGYEVTFELAANRSYRFRYLLDGVRWENDWQADSYVPNEYGGDDSLIDLTAPPLDLSHSYDHDGHTSKGARPKRSARRNPAVRTRSTEAGASAEPTAATGT